VFLQVRQKLLKFLQEAQVEIQTIKKSQ